MPSPRRIFELILLAGALAPHAGCLALNIPSERFADPADHGGLFGHWRAGNHASVHAGDAHAAGGHVAGGHPIAPMPFHGGDAVLIDGGPLEVDPFDPAFDVDGNPKQPEIPWPRFHPVPTRPVFGASSR